MASWADTLGNRLLADTAVTDLVGTLVMPSKPTQDPAGDHVTFWRTGGGDGARLDGATALAPHEVRVECVSTTQAGAEAIMRAVRASLHGWRDRSIGVQACFAVGDSDEDTRPDARQVSGQTFTLWFVPQ